MLTLKPFIALSLKNNEICVGTGSRGYLPQSEGEFILGPGKLFGRLEMNRQTWAMELSLSWFVDREI
jgi:hypothetical protein